MSVKPIIKTLLEQTGKIFDMNILFIMSLFIIMLPLYSNSQPIVNVGGGMHYDRPMFQIGAGYYHKVTIVGSYQAIPTTETERVNIYYGLKFGYDMKGFIPQVGYFMSKQGFNNVTYFLKYHTKISDNGDIYIEGGYLEQLQIALGFQINIT